MKKWIVFLLLVVLIATGVLIWGKKGNMLASMLSRKFGTEVTVGDLSLSSSKITIQNLHIYNPRLSKTATAFLCHNIDINIHLSTILKKEMYIDAITLSDINIGVETYNDNNNNWTMILNHDKGVKKKSYFIKTLELNNIKVSLMRANGEMTTFPPIDHLVFHNIKGLPIEQIEQAIMRAIINEVFKQLKLTDILESIFPKNILPNILQLPFMGQKHASAF
jgi:hypothetical protein